MTKRLAVRLVVTLCLTCTAGGVGSGCAAPQGAEERRASPVGDDRVTVGRYQLVPVNPMNVMVIDTATGRVWRKFVPPNEGPTQWDEQGPPFSRP